ncbi:MULTISPECIES: hypothetical protein, partial [unclassified Endozoicomonas]|uniref:hypothetical protein n=1 Tax=unclassified Endozoicomonas TaxID=2644528 RepID=UPI0021494D94
DLIALVIFGLIQMGSVNLSRIARTMGHGTEIDSRRKRLKCLLAVIPAGEYPLSLLYQDSLRNCPLQSCTRLLTIML